MPAGYRLLRSELQMAEHLERQGAGGCFVIFVMGSDHVIRSGCLPDGQRGAARLPHELYKEIKHSPARIPNRLEWESEILVISYERGIDVADRQVAGIQMAFTQAESQPALALAFVGGEIQRDRGEIVPRGKQVLAYGFCFGKSPDDFVGRFLLIYATKRFRLGQIDGEPDRKSTRLNSSHT